MKLRMIVLSFLISVSSLFSAQLQITNTSMLSSSVIKMTWTHNQTNYIVQYRTSLVSGTWMNLTNVVLSTNNMTITNWSPSCYYRIKKVSALNFPDVKFRAAVAGSIQNKFYPTNTIWDIDDVESITTLDVSSQGIKDITGVKELTGLLDFYVNQNSITNFDVSGMFNLRTLSCFGCGIKNINVTDCSSLSEFNCSENSLTNLNLNGCWPAFLGFENNAIKSFNVGYGLMYFYCSNNGMTNLTFTGCDGAYLVVAMNNNLKGILNVGTGKGWTYLDTVNVTGNPFLTKVQAPAATMLADPGVVCTYVP